MRLTEAQKDRACGMVLGAAVGDALGAGYEFAHVDENLVPKMIGGGLGNFEPGEWTDDTSMTYIVLEAAAKYKQHLGVSASLDQIALGFREWYDTHPPDIGTTTSRAIYGGGREPTSVSMMSSAVKVLGKSNGSLMRTSPVALSNLDDPNELGHVAMSVSALTHAHEDAMEACAVWCVILRQAVLTGELVLPKRLDFMSESSEGFWQKIMDKALSESPSTFSNNSMAVVALQAALSSVARHPQDFTEALYTAIRVGHDTDTVASIAGALAGALGGVKAIPNRWLDMLHGYPGRSGYDLENLVLKALED